MPSIDDMYESTLLRMLRARELVGWEGSTKVAGTFPQNFLKLKNAKKGRKVW